MPRLVRSVLARALVALVAVSVAFAGCTAPAASFDPNASCPPDGRAPGAYPELEARIPATLDGRTPERRDSGRNCSDQNLATLRARGLSEVRFAGAVWSDGAPKAVTLAVFAAPGLQPVWIAEWYEATARVSRHTSELTVSDPTVQGRPGKRLDVVNGDARQVILVWPTADGSVTQVVLASDEPEDRVQAAVAAFP